MQAAQPYVRAFRLTGGGTSVTMFGVGAGASRAATAVTPPGGLLLDGPRLVRQLLDLALKANGKGVVLHLNNLENLSERGVANAADILRSLRDTVLLQPGLHTLLVGTTEAVTAATSSHAQLRSVFTITALEPLPLPDVQALLAARYKHLRVRANRRVTPPVEPDAVGALYPVFRRTWKVSQPGVSQALKDLAVAGCVLALPKQAPGPTRYALTGASRLAFA